MSLKQECLMMADILDRIAAKSLTGEITPREAAGMIQKAGQRLRQSSMTAAPTMEDLTAAIQPKSG